MSDFTVRIVGGAEVTWTDAASLSPVAPSRLNPDPGHPPSYRQLLINNLVVPDTTGTLEIRAAVGGVDSPLDAALGGRLFFAAWAEWSGTTPPPIVQTVGQSSVATITFIANQHRGHFLFRFRRPGGGAILLPFDVETP